MSKNNWRERRYKQLKEVENAIKNEWRDEDEKKRLKKLAESMRKNLIPDDMYTIELKPTDKKEKEDG